ncbi:inactive pancreatic lipase-related protein 1-like isoform X2 [Nilaparvata lugens]|uniref:inactive pancreatic lipase-related protein 1-like isoform X2 n=1 Tax=Nilaparvata lugens TaxID=108931 RepID=UPI00193CBD73|nr:inactive pancreatic lipase-related protein 1-like isoform X2 [Nilaparvata lugens]
MQCSFLFLASCILSGLKELFKDEVCYENEKVGCFKTGYPWRSLTARPFFPPPQSPSVVNVTVTVFTRNTGPTIEDGHMVDIGNIIGFNDRDFDAARNKTFFIIHGFIDTGKKDWLRIMKDELLKKEDANVFIVGWGRGWFDIIHYPQAASNARVAGAVLARFIEHLNSEYNLPLDKIHLIGHSLGAHVASYAAKRMKGIGRLTGLDPAQPGFEDTPIEVRLDKTDALFVDVYHTDMRPFFPLGGFGMINPVAYLVCSHIRAYQYFTASINSKDCQVWAGKVKMPDKNRITSATFGSQPVYSLVKTCSLKTCTVAGYKADTPGLPREGVFSAITVLKDPPYCDPNHGGMIVDKNILSKMERYTEDESTIEISSEIPQVATMENDDMDEQADDFMFTSESGSQYFNEDDLYEIVTSRH